MGRPKPLPVKDYKNIQVNDLGIDERNSDDILKGLEIPERTQKPPSAELIARLNEIASRPPFSYLHKGKENNIR